MAERFCCLLNEQFGWELSVLKADGGFCEPSKPLADVAGPEALRRFLQILSQIAAEALVAPAG